MLKFCLNINPSTFSWFHHTKTFNKPQTLLIMQIYHKATISEKCIFASQIVLDSISETLTLLISRGRMLPDNLISRSYGLATPYSSKPKFCHPLSQCLNETLMLIFAIYI